MSDALTISGLRIRTRSHAVVDGIDLALRRGGIHGLAGESGSGKTMTALAVLGLLPGSMTASGSIRLADDTGDGTTELVGASRQVLGAVRGRRVAMVFQDPSTSLHPQLTVGRQLTDHLRHHLGLGKEAARSRAEALLERVRVPDARASLGRYPHQFSGGQRQRIAIAVALACEPSVLLADEPTTALDVTVQAGVLQLLRELVDDGGLSILLVTHDLGVMSAVADEVTVMRQGLVVESAPRERLFTAPEDEYTRALLAALPGSSFEESPEELVAELVEGHERAAAADDPGAATAGDVERGAR
ncbi:MULTISPECIES: ABC transporter ATP-binding protein [unclassified Rathayibacter]|uniref:ATP-binding cassette domain-containing protein n=1 Tax=unclassified Rathayibacter TaxID=2609250 RepID=UPI000CE82346|nr:MULTISPECIES: ABC transporter ATP-binding protein [unclassified Rathayibacter]PPF40699.1 ABC transporter ATP-binding protein [Rathayibacter sp. AY1A2]PPF48716.1 ABC transporter ATP-binding protein [Rathayibacter sp. AY1A1]PPG15356.1 ABC transporter ATP-binding protein [Rathayibacter sp. AY1C6]PPH01107.1 ABC transporter ATP-binding protein [Rathayibacter sp. AY1G9]PPH05787.1 ABC transporter ATP-binding protein [Rathayibacter sp. AY1F6]